MTRATAMIITLLLLLLSMTHLGSSRIISLTSDGAAKSLSTGRSTILKLNLTTTTTVTCEPIYGFLPCTTELWGQLFLVVIYEYLLSLGNHYVANGSELFFNMIGPGIFGASLFHILGTIPMVVLMLGTYAPLYLLPLIPFYTVSFGHTSVFLEGNLDRYLASFRTLAKLVYGLGVPRDYAQNDGE